MSQLKRGARALADVSQGTILAVVEIAATPERVFRALTTAEDMTAWWGADDMYRVTRWEADLRVGGAWRSYGKGADGSEFSVGGTYLEIEPPHLLVHTWDAAWDGGNITTIRYRLDAISGGTRVTVRHDGFEGRPESCASHTEGWERVLGWLEGYVGAREAKAPRQHFFCKLVPPRPTFGQDMTESERGVMQAHAAYWRELQSQGAAVIFGPVGDPQGVWGLGVIAAANEEERKALEAKDPVVLANLGFRYESLPMIQAVVRGEST